MIEKSLSIFFFLASLGYLFCANDLLFGSFAAPKLGFVPLMTGVAASVLALIDMIGVIRKKSRARDTQDTQPQVNPKKVILFSLGLAAYVALLNFVGFLPASIVVMIYLLKVTGVQGWVKPVIISALVAGGFYVVFEKLLAVMLP